MIKGKITKKISEQLLYLYIKEKKLPFTDIVFLAEGRDHYVFSFSCLKEKKIAKIPKGLHLVPNIKKEIELLDFLHTHCSNEVINKIQNGYSINNWRYPITICDQFEGYGLDKIEQPDNIYTEENIKILANILSEIHTSSQKANISFLPPHSFGNIEEKFSFISSMLSPKEKALFLDVIKHSDCFLLNSNSVPLHGDLGPANFIVNKEQTNIIGIIDFTNSSQGNFHCDLGRMRFMLQQKDNWNLFKDLYTKKTQYELVENDVLFCGFAHELCEVYTKIQNCDLPQRIDGAKKRALFFATKLVTEYIKPQHIRKRKNWREKDDFLHNV